MHENSAKLYCPNPTCQAVNSERHEFCQTCKTPLPKRYLRAIVLGEAYDSQIGGGTGSWGSDWADLDLGQLWGDRYWYKGDRVVLDTRPGLFPDLPEQVPSELEAYLRLFPHRWHVPQVYGRAGSPSQLKGRSIWLLENAPIRATHGGIWTLQPTLHDSWVDASPLRQLNWLLQIACLWQPCCHENVAQSLINVKCICVEGGMIRLPQLFKDVKPPSLERLGNIWTGLVARSQSPMREYLAQLCDLLTSGYIQTDEQLIVALNRAIEQAANNVSYHYRLTTLTDRGPSRSRNEDACYPPSGQAPFNDRTPLTLVCDGVGGHEGGDIASNLAIYTVEQQLQPLLNSRQAVSRDRLIRGIQDAILKANDAISDRNNQEQRHGRQRMGTTLVMLLARGGEFFVTHIGDSRAYLISPQNCYPITLDDDVATREVRLGYAFYRDALSRPAAGSLVQALGMGPSSNLHPTTTRFIIDEDCVFLLCSDGLSDYDRIEEIWPHEIQPALNRDANLQSIARKLIDIANTRNGHDNVTVSLLQVRVRAKSPKSDWGKSLKATLEDLPPPPLGDTATDFSNTDETESTELVSPPRKRSPWLRIGVLVILGAAIAAGVAYALEQMENEGGLLPNLSRQRPATPPSQLLDPGVAPLPKVGTVVRLNASLDLYDRPDSTAPPRTVPVDNQLFTVDSLQRTDEDAPDWVQLRPCASSPLPIGGWVTLQQLESIDFEILDEVPEGCRPDAPTENESQRLLLPTVQQPIATDYRSE